MTGWKIQKREGALCLAIACAVLSMSSPLRAQEVLLKGEMNTVSVYSTHAGEINSSPLAPRTSLGIEWGRKLNTNSERRLVLDSADLLVRFTYDPIKHKTLPIPVDVWARFRVGPRDTLRVGHFQVPFGLNPVLEPRSSFLLPLGAYDLGFKWDWGAEYKGSSGVYDYNLAGTIGLGERLQRPDGSYLLAGRIGTPTYKDRQFGISVLAGSLPGMMMNHLLLPDKVRRWRIGLDATAMRRPYDVRMAEIFYGQNGGTPVGGVMLAMDHILRRAPHYSVEGQVVAWFSDLSDSRSDNTLVTLALARTLLNTMVVRLVWVHNVHIAMGEPFMGTTGDNRVFLQVYRTFDLH
jgi:hypothetical protein